MSDKTKYINNNADTIEYDVTVARIIDGDTFVDTDGNTHRDGFGFNAPESNTSEGKIATQYLKDTVPIGSNLTVVTYKDSLKQDTLVDRYGRKIAPIFLPDGNAWGPSMLERGYGNLDYIGLVDGDIINKDAVKDLYLKIYKNNKPGERGITTTEKINRTRNILSDAEKYGWFVDGSLLPGACKIGAVWVPVTPSQIVIQEININEAIDTVRTPGNPKVKTGKQDIRIDLELFFPSLYDINTRLRPLLAQFIRSPFMPIENEHIRNLIFPDVIWSRPEKSIKRDVGDIPFLNASVYERTTSKNGDVGVFANTHEKFWDNVKATFKAKRTEAEANIAKFTDKIRYATTTTEREEYTKEKDYWTNRLLSLREDNIASDMISYEKEPGVFDDTTVAVALQNFAISTVPGFPETMQCNLTLSVFNYHAYSYDFSFMKNLESAAKQIEYFSSKHTLQYPENVRNVLGMTIYDSPKDLKSTKNMEESEPFLAYITPLLTGNNFSSDISFNMKKNGVTKPVQINRKFSFTAPQNYLREVNSTEEFKSIKMEYEVSDLTAEEFDLYDYATRKVDAEIISDLKELMDGIGYYSVIDKYKREWADALFKIKKLMNYELLRKNIRTFEKQLSEYEETVVIMPFRIEVNGIIYLRKGQEVPIRGFLKIMEDLPQQSGSTVTGKNIMDKMRTQLALNSTKTYGFRNVYKFTIDDDDDTVFTGMTASYGTRLAQVPLLNYVLPTYQSMGKEDWNISVNFQTCNSYLIRILRSLSNKVTKGRLLREKTGKSWWINKSNALFLDPDAIANGFFKMIGVNNVLFDSFQYETIKDKPGWWNISIRFVQADLDIFSYESLLPVNFIKEEYIEEIKNKLLKKYVWKQDNSYNTLKNKYPYKLQYIDNNIRLAIYRMAMNCFYGGDLSQPPLPEIVNTDGIGQYFATDSEIQEQIRTFSRATFTQFLITKFAKLSGKKEEYFRNDLLNAVGNPIGYSTKKITSLVPGMDITTVNREMDINGNKLSWDNFSRRVAGTVRVGSEDSIFGVDVNFKAFQAAAFDLRLRTLAEQYLISAPEEALEFLNDGRSIKLEKIDIRAVTNNEKTWNGSNIDLYSNYLDLNLPSYSGGIFSTPADFFYTKFDNDIVPFSTVRQKIKGTWDLYKSSWKYQMVDGLALYMDGYASEGKYVVPLTKKEKASRQTELANKKEILNKNRSKLTRDLIKIAEAEIKRIENSLNKAYLFILGKDKDEEEIRKLAKEVKSKWRTYYRRLNSDESKSLVANASEFDLKQAVGIMTLLRLGAVEDQIEELDKKRSENNMSIKTSVYDRLISKRDDLLGQIGMLQSIATDDLFGVVTPWSLEKLDEVLNRVHDSYNTFKSKDKTYTMERAFPTAKLYFIEEDSKSWGAFDDYYSYNAIESIDIIVSKNSASKVANIVLSNVSGNLTNPYSVNKKEAPLKDGSLEEQNVLNLYLREGMTIMIKEGYDNNSDNLENTFMGKIVSTSLGDKVTIIAQSFGAEMLEVINNGIPERISYFSAGRTHGDVVTWAANNMNGLEHFGSTSVFERLGAFDRTSYPFYGSPKWKVLDMVRSVHPIVDFFFKMNVYDPRFENIYLSYSKLAMNPIAQSITDMALSVMDKPNKGFNTIKTVTSGIMKSVSVVGGLVSPVMIKGKKKSVLNQSILNATKYNLVDNGANTFSSYYFSLLGNALGQEDESSIFWHCTFSWVIEENKNLWNLLKEISLYHEDYIITTLPYNTMKPGQTRETIYVGPRDGLYKYTDIFDSSEYFEKIRKEVQLRKKIYSLTLNTRNREELRKEYKNVENSLKEYETKISSGKRLDPSELSLYTRLLKKYSEYIEMFDAVKNFNIDITENDNRKDLNADLVNNISSYTSKLDNKTRQNVEETITELHQNITNSKDDTWKSYSEERLNSYGKNKTPFITELEATNTFEKIDSIAEILRAKYPSLTTDQKDEKFNSDIMWSMSNPDDFMINENGKDKVKFPGYQNVINYYYLDSASHIISNEIIASSEDVSNHVVLKYPGDPTLKQNEDLLTKEFFADDNIRGSNIRTYISKQNNIDPISVPMVSKDLDNLYTLIKKKFLKNNTYGYLPRVYLVGYNVLANHLRPMYKGSITVSGMPWIKPYDVCFINDTYHHMFGPIEVETVKHHYGKDGFFTEIMPNAIVSYQKPGKQAELSAMQHFKIPIPMTSFNVDLLDWDLYKAVGMGSIGGGLLAGALSNPFTAIGGVALGTAVLAGAYSLWSWNFSTFMGRDMIHVCGLWLNNRPLVAGLEGMYKDNMQVHYMDEIKNFFNYDLSVIGGGE